MTEAAAHANLLVGVSENDITPPLGTQLAGYFAPRISDGVISPLMAKALVVGAGAERCVLICCDLITMTAELCEASRSLITAATGIAGERIMICSTHTHTGPELRVRRNGIIAVNQEYLTGLPGQIAAAAITAAGRQREAVLCLGREHEEGLSFNRRFRMEDASEQFGPGGALKCEGVAGPIDPAFGALIFKEELTSKPFAIVCNYSVHIDVTGGTKISADFPAVMTNTLRAVYGPELIVMYVQGACGNINHCAYLQNNPYPGKGVWKSEQLGRAFAGKALTIAEKALPSKTVKVGAAREILDVPMYPRDMVLERRLAAAKAKAEPSAPEKRLIELADSYDPTGSTPREVQTLRIGDAVFCGAPGEYFVEWGMEIKKWSPFAYTFIAELCNDSAGYIPTYEAFMRGGYEATPVVSVRSTPALGQMIADANFRNLRRLAD